MEATAALKAKVGALILVALALLVGFVVVLGNLSLGPRRVLHVTFADSGSLLTGAPVKIAGVRAGKVTAVTFLPPGAAPPQPTAGQPRPAAPAAGAQTEPGAPVNVRISLAIDEALAGAVRGDSQFLITTQGVLGEKYIEIVPGTAATEPWPEGSQVRGTDPPRVDLLFARVDRILGQVETALGTEGGLPIGELVATVGRLAHHLDTLLVANRAHLDRLLASLPGAVEEARGLLRGLRSGVGDGQHLHHLLADARATAAAAAAAVGPLTAQARSTLGRADRALGAGERLLGAAESTLAELRPDLKSTAAQAAAALAQLGPTALRLDAVLHDAQWLMDHLRRGQGTIGALLADQVIYDDLKAMLRDLKRNPWKFLWKD